MSTGNVISVDLIVVVFSAWVLLHLPGKSLYHPAVMYWLFHVAVVTSRLWLWHYGIWTVGEFLLQTDLDLVRAGIASDLGLLFFVLGAIIGSLGPIRLGPSEGMDDRFRRAVWTTAPFFAVVGIYAIMRWSPLAGRLAMTGVWSSAQSTMTWLFQVCVLLREQTRSVVSRRLFGLAVILLLFLQIANGTRANFVLSVLLLVVIALLRRGQRWPTLKQTCALAATAIFFFFAKPFAGTLVASGSLQQAVLAVSVYSGGSGIALDFEFLDMQAAYMKNILAYGKYLWGRPYLASLVFFVPLAWWASKPSIVAYRFLYSTPEIPISTYGITPNLVGDLYVNFGYLGVTLGMILLALLLTRIYRICASSQAGLARQVWLAVMVVSLVQVYRDGLSSLVLWPFLWFLPLTASALLGLILRDRRVRVSSDSASRGRVT